MGFSYVVTDTYRPRSGVYLSSAVDNGQAVQQHCSGPEQGGHVDFEITIHEQIGVVAGGEPALACADPACPLPHLRLLWPGPRSR